MKHSSKIVLVFILFFSFTGCARQPAPTPSPMPHEEPTPSPSPSSAPTPTPFPTPDPAQIKEDFIDSILDDMTVEEMVGQLFIAACRLDASDDPVLTASQGFDDLITSYRLGGVILFAENIETIDQTASLIADMQEASAVPLFVSTDEEGGRVSRVGANTAMEATDFPPMADVGTAGDPELARSVGRVMGEELYALGFNMDFAPVADVFTNPQNTVIGDRAFSSDPQTAAEMVGAFVDGMQSSGVAAVIKHFPGHGDTTADTHKGTVSVSHDLARLREVEFVPFRAGIGAGSVGVMSAHIGAPNVTGDDTPSTLSHVMLADILRGELRFQGLIITDALEMKAISGTYASGDACVRAFLAGADLLLMPLSMADGYQGVLRAVQDGAIGEDRLRESVMRILSVKYDLGLFAGEPLPDPHTVLGSPEHLAVAEAVKSAAEAAR